MTNLKMSQGLEVLQPKADKAIPIPCKEWDVLKKNISALATEPWVFHTAGSTLVGAAFATLISIWTGSVAPMPEMNLIIAWAITAVCGLVGVSSLVFAQAQRKAHKNMANAVSTQMELIEDRFERD